MCQSKVTVQTAREKVKTLVNIGRAIRSTAGHHERQIYLHVYDVYGCLSVKLNEVKRRGQTTVFKPHLLDTYDGLMALRLLRRARKRISGRLLHVIARLQSKMVENGMHIYHARMKNKQTVHSRTYLKEPPLRM